jgi:transcriptional regulator with XRE-family HTH domain
MTEPGIAAGGAETSAENLGLLVGMLRLLRGWSQQDLAQAAAMHQTTVSKYEMGSPPPGWTELVRLAAAVGMPMWAVGGVLVGFLRLLAKRTQRDMAAAAAIHAATLSRYEQGRQVPGPATIARLAAVARLPLWFLDGVLVPVIDFARLLLH